MVEKKEKKQLHGIFYCPYNVEDPLSSSAFKLTAFQHLLHFLLEVFYIGLTKWKMSKVYTKHQEIDFCLTLTSV